MYIKAALMPLSRGLEIPLLRTIILTWPLYKPEASEGYYVSICVK